MKMDVPPRFVLVGLGRGDGERDVAVQLEHRQAGNLPHSGVVLLDPQHEVQVWLLNAMGH